MASAPSSTPPIPCVSLVLREGRQHNVIDQMVPLARIHKDKPSAMAGLLDRVSSAALGCSDVLARFMCLKACSTVQLCLRKSPWQGVKIKNKHVTIGWPCLVSKHLLWLCLAAHQITLCSLVAAASQRVFVQLQTCARCVSRCHWSVPRFEDSRDSVGCRGESWQCCIRGTFPGRQRRHIQDSSAVPIGWRREGV